MSRRRGFTLIELLVVMAVISILLGILIPTLINVRIRAMVAAAKSDISNIQNALQMYHSDWGSYPASGNAELVARLKDVPRNQTTGTYMSFKANQLVGGQFNDPFGHPYVYCLRGDNPDDLKPDATGLYFYIYSLGPNEEDDSTGILGDWRGANNNADLLQQQPDDDVTSWY